jgi:hypothetical protein
VTGGDSVFEVVWPLAASTEQGVTLSRRLGVEGSKRIGFVWDYVFRGDEMFAVLEAGLAERFPGSTFVPYEAFGNIHGHDERAVIRALPERLRAERVDAVVVGVGA